MQLLMLVNALLHQIFNSFDGNAQFAAIGALHHKAALALLVTEKHTHAINAQQHKHRTHATENKRQSAVLPHDEIRNRLQRRCG